MAQTSKTSDPSVISTSVPVAEWARWRRRDLANPIAALRVGSAVPTGFVPDHVLVDRSDKDLVHLLIREHGAEIILAGPLPPRPNGLGPRKGVDPTAMPVSVRLRLRNPPPVSLRGHDALKAHVHGLITTSSEVDARLIALVAEHAADQRHIGLDAMGVSDTLPLLTSTDPFANPFNTSAFTGRANICAAWQLVEAFRQIKPLKSPVLVAILDGGFWLNGQVPGVSPLERASDFGSFVLQLNLLDEGVGAGGASPTKCGGTYSCDWHGNGTASTATAPVGNGFGAAGVGGTVARPVLMKTDTSISQIVRGVNVCLDWGVDVLNMSFHISMPEIVFPTKLWNATFGFAANNGLIMVASAGNDGVSLPDDENIKPATRTPGTITVGWLDTGDNANASSNFGSSVDIWAPGDNIPVMPDPANFGGSKQSGTSLSAPIVSGVAAMIRAVNPSVDNDQVKHLITDNGWKGNGRVSVGLDAFAAVLAAMGGRLPPDESLPNNTPQTASPMRLISPGRFVPYDVGRNAAFLSGGGDEDWYKFRVDEFSQMDVQVNLYPLVANLLGTIFVSLEPDDDMSQALAEQTKTNAPGFSRLQGLLAPGGYKLHVHGPLNMYELTLDLKAAPLEPDEFEPNNSFDTATRFRVSDPLKLGEIPEVVGPHTPGSYDLNLHVPADVDFFRIETLPSANPLNVPVVRIARSDEPIDVVLFDAQQKQLAPRLTGVQEGHFPIPTGESPFFFVKISGKSSTRYTFSLRYEIDQVSLPGPNQKRATVSTPDPGDPASRLDKGMDHILFVVDDARREAGNLVLGSVEGRAIEASLVDQEGAFVSAAVPAGDGMHQAVEIKVADLKAGNYFIKVGAAGAGRAFATGPLNIEALPNLRQHNQVG
jgi:hypothetical protein